jgi:hypothetical protein
VQQRRLRRERDTVRRRQLVADDLGFGCFKRPGQVMNVANENFASEGGEEAIALGKEVLQRAGRAWMGNRAEAAIARFEADVPRDAPRDARRYEKASAGVVDGAAAQRLAAHAGVEVRKMEEGAGS